VCRSNEVSKEAQGSPPCITRNRKSISQKHLTQANKNKGKHIQINQPPLRVGDVVAGNFKGKGSIPIRIQSLDQLESRNIIHVKLFELVGTSSSTNTTQWYQETNEDFYILRAHCTYPVKLEWRNKNDLSICRILSVDDADILCMKCKKGDDEENLILCDCCEEGIHTFCCVPQLTRVPSGEFLCPSCDNV